MRDVPRGGVVGGEHKVTLTSHGMDLSGEVSLQSLVVISSHGVDLYVCVIGLIWRH